MSAQVELSVDDGKATPVEHVFSVAGAFSEGGEIVAKWMNREASALTGGAELFLSYFKPKKDGAFSVRHTLIMPVTDEVSGVDQVVRTLRATITFDIPANATAGERKDLEVMMRNLLGYDPQVTSVVHDGVPFF
jgi:hypothetical protein